MDIDKPPSPDPVVVQSRIALAYTAAVHGRAVIASGVGWTLVDLGEAMELRLTGAQPLTVSDGHWRDTPRGRRLTALTARGPLILDVTHGLCRPAGGSGDSQEATSGFARMTLPDGRRMHGCMFAIGPYADRGYPGR